MPASSPIVGEPDAIDEHPKARIGMKRCQCGIEEEESVEPLLYVCGED